ncbi:unnamed protein product [Paramecium primaurelia]|uniref:Uncharacterized protein n=1 Tax=Paramecium primaurelia TaxID=5886 RepID=A0A8S1N0M5_PARPR|nr:unnamed protein product [Paramecium primaurelia]
MKLLSIEQSESESHQSQTESQISEEESLSNNIDQQIVKDEQNLNKLKFFDPQNQGWNEIIQLIGLIKGQSSINKITKVKKIKKFQPKLNCQKRERQEKMNQKKMLKQIAIDDIEELLQNL